MTAARLQGPVLVTGATGMLGSELLRTAPAGVEALGTGRSARPVTFPLVDLAEPGAAEALLARFFLGNWGDRGNTLAENLRRRCGAGSGDQRHFHLL